MTAAVPAFLIVQEVAAGNQFTKELPTEGPAATASIHKFLNRNKGGRFVFSNTLFFQARRIVADFGDAKSWSIGIRHIISSTITYPDGIETLYDSSTEAASQVVTFQITGGTDGDYTITINGTDYTVNATGQTAIQIAASLATLVDANAAVDAIQLPAAADDTVQVTAISAGVAFTYASASTGDPITEAVVTASVGSLTSSVFRLDLIRELAPGESIVVETAGASTPMSVEILAFPATANFVAPL